MRRECTSEVQRPRWIRREWMDPEWLQSTAIRTHFIFDCEVARFNGLPSIE